MDKRKNRSAHGNSAPSYVIEDDLDNAYKQMAEDEDREIDAMEWAEALISDISTHHSRKRD